MAAKLNEADGGIAGELHQETLAEPIVFVPDFADPLTLPDLDSGGVANQEGANAEFAAYILFLKKHNGKLQSLIFEDPWASIADLDYTGEEQEELVPLFGRLCYVYDLSALHPERIWEFRSVAVSYLKLAYVSEMTAGRIRALAEAEPDDLLHRIAHSIRHVAVNAYDDESWLIASHGA
jgi:hypothetical protein